MAELQDSIRLIRNTLLRDSDWTQMGDSPLTAEIKADWATYRQQLRDLPEDQNIDEMESQSEVVWPEQPE